MLLFFSLFSFFSSGPNSHPVISESTDRSSPNFRIARCNGALLSIHPFCDCSRDVAMVAGFVVKFAKLADPIIIWHAGVLKRIAGLPFRFQKIKWQWFLYIVEKLGEIRFSNPGVYDIRMCTAASIIHHYVRKGATLLGTAAISNRVCFTPIR